MRRENELEYTRISNECKEVLLQVQIQNSRQNRDQNALETEVLVQDLLEILQERNNQVSPN